MIRVTTTFLRGEVAASNRERKKSFPSWKQQEVGQKQNFKKGSFRNQQRPERKQDRFTLLIKTPKETLTLDKGTFKPPPPMTTPVEKRNASKFCEFHGEVGHTTDECMHLKRQIEEILKAKKLSHLIKELKQSSEKDQAKAAKKKENLRKGKTAGNTDGTTMAEGSQTKDYSNFLSGISNLFSALREEDGTEGPIIIEAEIGGHFVLRMYVDGGSSSEILYEHCFNRFRPEVRSQMIPATTPLVGFSGEIIWPLRQISLLVKIGDEEHSTSAWMNFMVVRSPSPYNRIIGRPGVRRIQAVSSTAHGMLKFPVAGGTVAIHPEYPEQTIAIDSTLTEEGRKELCGLLRRNLDIFAWKPADITGVPQHIAEHRLNIRKGCLPARQKKRGQAPERNKAIYEEVEKLVDAGIMKEVNYHSWLSNPDLALNVDNVFQADDYDAFDYDVDEAPTAQTMFMANLSSADLIYDEAGPSYDSDILSEVHDHDHYQDAVCEHHEEHEIHDDVQPNYVVDSHTDYTSNSNMIPYDQYVKDNVVPVVQSNVSFVTNDVYMMIYNDMCEPHAQSVSKTTRNIVVGNSLTAELETYKEQVELYERRARFELTKREQKIDEQLRIVITDRNIKEENLKKELHSIKLQLASTINHNKSMVEEVTSLKKDFKQKVLIPNLDRFLTL
ncbi:hypothetical protein Tco_1440232 [Tanacetum coccineum]